MANHIATHPKPVSPRKGKAGNVVLTVTVTPELKAALTALADQYGTTLAHQVRFALETWTNWNIRRTS